MNAVTGFDLSFISNLVCRRLGKEANESSSDEEHELSEEEMDWNGNDDLFADLSIPQLDGAADENSGVYYHITPKTQRTLHTIS